MPGQGWPYINTAAAAAASGSLTATTVLPTATTENKNQVFVLNSGDGIAYTAVRQINAGPGTPSPFTADIGTGGAPYSYTTGVAPSNLAALNLPAPSAVYTSASISATLMSYNITGLTPSTTYQVRIHLLESYYTSAGGRIYNLDCNGIRVDSGVDIFSRAGGQNLAYIDEYIIKSTSTGVILIEFKAVKDYVGPCGIEIYAITGTGVAGDDRLFHSRSLGSGKYEMLQLGPPRTKLLTSTAADQSLTTGFVNANALSVVLPGYGDYYLQATLSILGDTIIGDDISARLFNSTTNLAIPKSDARITTSYTLGRTQISLSAVITVDKATTVSVQVKNATSARGYLVQTNSLLQWTQVTKYFSNLFYDARFKLVEAANTFPVAHVDVYSASLAYTVALKHQPDGGIAGIGSGIWTADGSSLPYATDYQFTIYPSAGGIAFTNPGFIPGQATSDIIFTLTSPTWVISGGQSKTGTF